MFNADKTKCECKSHLRFVETKYVAASATGVTPVVTMVPYSIKCDVCGKTKACVEGEKCEGTADANTCAPASVAVTCADETLKKAACATCGSEDKKCTVCVNA